MRFPSQYYDKTTGLHNNHNRYFAPDLGRYLEPDPIGLEGGRNPHNYAGNDPVNNIDPSGLIALSINGNVVADTSPNVTFQFSNQVKDVSNFASFARDIYNRNYVSVAYNYVFSSFDRNLRSSVQPKFKYNMFEDGFKEEQNSFYVLEAKLYKLFESTNFTYKYESLGAYSVDEKEAEAFFNISYSKYPNEMKRFYGPNPNSFIKQANLERINSIKQQGADGIRKFMGLDKLP